MEPEPNNEPGLIDIPEGDKFKELNYYNLRKKADVSKDPFDNILNQEDSKKENAFTIADGQTAATGFAEGNVFNLFQYMQKSKKQTGSVSDLIEEFIQGAKVNAEIRGLNNFVEKKEKKEYQSANEIIQGEFKVEDPEETFSLYAIFYKSKNKTIARLLRLHSITRDNDYLWAYVSSVGGKVNIEEKPILPQKAKANLYFGIAKAVPSKETDLLKSYNRILTGRYVTTKSDFLQPHFYRPGSQNENLALYYETDAGNFKFHKYEGFAIQSKVKQLMLTHIGNNGISEKLANLNESNEYDDDDFENFDLREMVFKPFDMATQIKQDPSTTTTDEPDKGKGGENPKEPAISPTGDSSTSEGTGLDSTESAEQESDVGQSEDSITSQESKDEDLREQIKTLEKENRKLRTTLQSVQGQFAKLSIRKTSAASDQAIKPEEIPGSISAYDTAYPVDEYSDRVFTGLTNDINGEIEGQMRIMNRSDRLTVLFPENNARIHLSEFYYEGNDEYFYLFMTNKDGSVVVASKTENFTMFNNIPTLPGVPDFIVCNGTQIKLSGFNDNRIEYKTPQYAVYLYMSKKNSRYLLHHILVIQGKKIIQQ